MATDWQRVQRTDDGDLPSQVLANERRRLVLAVLAEASAPVALGDLASLVACREAGRGREGIDERTDTIHVALYHKDVPKLDDADLVDWDRDRDVVGPGPDFADGIAFVEAIADAEGGRTGGSR